jgi:protein ImuA
VGRNILSELFATHPRDAGWCGFLLAHPPREGPVLWVQERMAILESGRIFPPGLPFTDLIHVEARDARTALWAMEEGLRCSALSLVIGEIWGDPAALDFTATRRLAVAAERHGVAACLIRLGGHPNLSGARMRWRLASSPSAPNPFDPKAPGAPAWDAELFRARSRAPGRWRIGGEGNPSKYYFDGTGDPAQDQDPVRRFPHFVDGPMAALIRRSA